MHAYTNGASERNHETRDARLAVRLILRRIKASPSLAATIATLAGFKMEAR
jgi:hypothetical protein